MSLAAKHLVLFQKDGAFHEDYSNLQIEVNDTVEFSDGEIFTVLEILGSGNTTRVLKVSDNMALRIPLGGFDEYQDAGTGPVKIDTKEAHRGALNSYMRGYDRVLDVGFSVPKVFQHNNGEYIEVEFIDAKFNIADYLSGEIDLSPEVSDVVDRMLIEISIKTYDSKAGGDFRPEQMVFDGKRIVLLDWSDSFEVGDEVKDSMLFKRSDFSYARRGLFSKIREEVRRRRIADPAFLHSGFCKRLLKKASRYLKE